MATPVYFPSWPLLSRSPWAHTHGRVPVSPQRMTRVGEILSSLFVLEGRSGYLTIP